MDATSTQNYIEILEKTNQQLSLWYNPYGILIGVLTLLLAFLAILFTYILWRQGADYKKTFESFLDERRKFIDGETQRTIRHLQITINSVIEDWQKKLETTSGETKMRAEAELEKLRKVRESFSGTDPIQRMAQGMSYAEPPYSQPVSGGGDLLSDLQAQVQALLAQIAALQGPEDGGRRR